MISSFLATALSDDMKPLPLNYKETNGLLDLSFITLSFFILASLLCFGCDTGFLSVLIAADPVVVGGGNGTGRIIRPNSQLCVWGVDKGRLIMRMPHLS